MANNTSQHILGTAANLLGFCLIVLTSLHFTSRTANTIVDEATSFVALLLLLSAGFSFASIRTHNARKEEKYETVADYLFMISLVGIFFIVLFMLVNYWLE